MDANVKPKSNYVVELRTWSPKSNSEIQLWNRTTKLKPELGIEQRNAVQYNAIVMPWCHKSGRSQPKTKNFQPDYLQIPIPQLSTVSLLCNFCKFVICNCKMWKKVLWKCSKYLNVHWATNPLSYLSTQTHFYVQTHFGFLTWVLWVSVFFPRLFSVQNLAFCVT